MGEENSEEKMKISRRIFLGRVGKATIAAAATAGAGVWLSRREPGGMIEAATISDFSPPPAKDAQMVVTRGQEPADMVQRAIKAIGGIERFVSKDDVVLIKPNVAFDRPPFYGATTDPDVVGEVVSLCMKAGAKEVLVTDNPINNPSGCFDRSGIGEAVRTSGGKVLLPEKSMFKRVKIGGKVIREWEVLYEPFARADKLIGLPCAKDHNLSRASLSMKNWYGFLSGSRANLHQHIHGAIADLGGWLRPTLILMDATRTLMRNGPTGGSPDDVVETNTIIAGTDPVAIDAWTGVNLLERSLGELEFVSTAEKNGAGKSDWGKLRMEVIDIR
jgi:uncharacterized protein (DUF362 family)